MQPSGWSIAIHLAAVVGVYIVGVTWFARTEEGKSNRRQPAPRGRLDASLVLALCCVRICSRRRDAEPPLEARAPSPSRTYWWRSVSSSACRSARGHRRPAPKKVQAAVKRCVLGLVALDAVLATAFVGLPGLLILLLLPPALLLGKWVYST